MSQRRASIVSLASAKEKLMTYAPNIVNSCQDFSLSVKVTYLI